MTGTNASTSPTEPLGSDTPPLVLYVEDTAANVRLMEAVFRARPGYRMISAPTAEDGIEMAWSERPQLVLMDINLPGMDGYAALAVLRGDDRSAALPIVAVTSDAMLGDAERGLAAGFDDYVTKPIDVSALYDLLDRYLAAGAAS